MRLLTLSVWLCFVGFTFLLGFATEQTDFYLAALVGCSMLCFAWHLTWAMQVTVWFIGSCGLILIWHGLIHLWLWLPRSRVLIGQRVIVTNFRWHHCRVLHQWITLPARVVPAQAVMLYQKMRIVDVKQGYVWVTPCR